MLNALANESLIISAALGKLTTEEKAKYSTNSTAKEWFVRRATNQRMKNRRVGPSVPRHVTQSKPKLSKRGQKHGVPARAWNISLKQSKRSISLNCTFVSSDILKSSFDHVLAHLNIILTAT